MSTENTHTHTHTHKLILSQSINQVTAATKVP